MQNIFQVQGEGESLVARLIEDGGQIELTYINPKGDSQVGVYRNGMEISARVTMTNGMCPSEDVQGNSHLTGYMAAYDRLGPELRKQIPSDWRVALGRWLAPKE